MKRTLAGGQMLRWRHLCLTVTPVKATMPAYLVGILALPSRGRYRATNERHRETTMREESFSSAFRSTSITGSWLTPDWTSSTSSFGKSKRRRQCLAPIPIRVII